MPAQAPIHALPRRFREAAIASSSVTVANMVAVPAFSSLYPAQQPHLERGASRSCGGLSGDGGHRGAAPAHRSKTLPEPLLKIAIVDHAWLPPNAIRFVRYGTEAISSSQHAKQTASLVPRSAHPEQAGPDSIRKCPDGPNADHLQWPPIAELSATGRRPSRIHDPLMR